MLKTVHKGTDESDQYCWWTDKFKFSLSVGQKRWKDLYYKTMSGRLIMKLLKFEVGKNDKNLH